MLSNSDKAVYGTQAITAGTPDHGQNGDDLDGLLIDATDAIANIMHALARAAEPEHGADYAADYAAGALTAAEGHFEAEHGGDDFSDPLGDTE